MVTLGWPQVLGDRYQIAASLVKVNKCLINFGFLFTHPKDQIAFGDESSITGLGYHIQASVVAKCGAN
jgi:hypothetical protein